MKTFLDTNISKSKTFVLYGNLKDTIWCPDLMPRDIEHYLVKLLKSRGYEHIIFYGEAGTKGAYCLDEKSARFFFSANLNIPLPQMFSDGFEESTETTEIQYTEIESQEVNSHTTGSQVSDALDELFGDNDNDEYFPGDISGVPEDERENEVAAEPTREPVPLRQRVRYSYRGQTISEFLQKIHPLMLQKNSHMAVVFYNILTTDIKSSDLKDDILDIWEKNSRGNICLMLFPETLYNESALENKIRQFGLESKFLRRSCGENGSALNPINCFKVAQPGSDEICNVLRYLTLLGTANGNKIKFMYSDIKKLADHILLSSKVNAHRQRQGFEFMSEMYERLCTFIDAEYQANPNWDGVMKDEVIDIMYDTKGYKKRNLDLVPKNKERSADWGVERISTEPPAAEEEKTLDQLMEELDSLVGLAEVKKEIKSLIAVQQNNDRRSERGLPIPDLSLHMVFTGSPGTGKTTVARLVGKIYKAIGALSQGQTIEVGREDLVAPYVGQTAPKTLSVIEKAQGGVLFVDEAYTLSKGGEQDFGREAINTLLRHMENNRDDLVVIVAGYPEKMKEFINSNEGLQSRFKKYVNFENYSLDELMDIFTYCCKKDQYTTNDLSYEKAKEVMRLGQKFGGPDFGNGRYVRNVYETAISNLSVRISKLDTITAEDASCFMPEDFVLPSNIDVDKNEMNEDATLDKLLNELDSLIGLTNVKAKVHELVALQNYNKLCSEKEIPVIDQSLHMVFTGNPGTGKTVVARLIGKIYHSIGILSQGQLVEAGREDLVGQYVGHTAQKTKDILDSAKGGVLFIDEAYTLTSTSSNDYGQEAVDTLLRYMENNRDDFVVIVAGYPNEMEAFISSNPGLTSRFTQYIHFEDYSVDELMQILVGMAEKSGHRLDQDAVVHATNIIEKGKKNGGRDFGNGRYVRNLYEAAIRKLAGRMAANHTASFEEMTTLIASDFLLPANIKSDNIEQTKSTEQLLEELDQFIGLDQVKTQVRKMINQVNMNQKRRERGIPVTKTSLHMVFTGNPGTGKTTVARMMGELYKSIGVLPSGQLIEVGREDLVGQYVGQTAQKTKAVLDSALGGVLFIDEAYTLSNSTTNDFGQEAIDTILRHMENERDKLVVIVAGYPCEMNDFIQSNPGLKSRFTTTVNFEDYSIEQLLKIFELQCVKNGYSLTENAKSKVEELLLYEKQTNGYNFGNGRVVRNIFEAAILNQNDRISQIENLTDGELMELTEDDFM